MVKRGLEDATGRMPMGRLAGVAGFAVVMVLLSSAGNARADVVVRIDKSSQRMSVIVNGEHRYTWAVSTGIYGTPSGTFRPAVAGAVSPLDPLQQCADAIFDLLRRQFRHPRHDARVPARRTGVAWLHQAASLQRRRPVLPGAATGPGQHQNFDPLEHVHLGLMHSDARTRCTPSPRDSGERVQTEFAARSRRLSAGPNRRRGRARR